MKDKQESLVKPRPVAGFSKPLAIHLPVDPASPELLAKIEKRAISVKPMEGFRLFLLPDRIIITEAMSAALAALALERLRASGLREIILLGIAGSLSPEFRVGQALLVEKALVDEGTSPHYFPRRRLFAPSPRLNSQIEEKLTSLGLPYRRAKVISTDAPFRETKEWRAAAQSRGAQVVDMETSAVLAVAAFYHLSATALLIISDELFGSRWKAGFSSPRLKKAAMDYFFPFIFSS
jgi:uridine phosphorylase